MNTTKYVITMITIWVIGIILSVAGTCGIIWFALWAAKHFGII